MCLGKQIVYLQHADTAQDHPGWIVLEYRSLSFIIRYLAELIPENIATCYQFRKISFWVHDTGSGSFCIRIFAPKTTATNRKEQPEYSRKNRIQLRTSAVIPAHFPAAINSIDLQLEMAARFAN
jgi:hypothetical protein